MVNSGLMVNSTKFLSRFKIDFIGIKHWGVDCFAIQAKRSPPTLSSQTRETRRCECEDGFSRPGPPLSQALHFELSTQNGKDQAYSQYIYGFGCRMRLEITATQASASAGSSARNG